MGNHQIFTTDIDLRFRDLDAMGHVNNAVYFSFFEHGRLKFLYSEDQKDKFPDMTFILAHASCDYLVPITLECDPVLHLWVKKIGGKSFTFKYRLVERENKDRIYATGESVQVYFDYQENRSIPTPDAICKQLEVFLE